VRRKDRCPYCNPSEMSTRSRCESGMRRFADLEAPVMSTTGAIGCMFVWQM